MVGLVMAMQARRGSVGLVPLWPVTFRQGWRGIVSYDAAWRGKLRPCMAS